MKVKNVLAEISRDFLKSKNVTRYRMKKISDMDDDEVVQKCHWYCEDHHLMSEWWKFRGKAESHYRFCPYLKGSIDNEICYDMQMIAHGYIKQSALPEIKIDSEECAKCCFDCRYNDLQ